jgi:hypothetical protein
LSFGFFPSDVIANILGYVPVGIVLEEMGPATAIFVGVVIAILAEGAQFAMMHRDPSIVDVASNAIGATVGVLVRSRWGIAQAFELDRRRALIAATIAIVLIIQVWATSGFPPSDRGATLPGALEAHWKFDESAGRTASDSSGHGLTGTFRKEPKRIAGILGGAVALNGADYVSFGHSSVLRLVGSMTISAWIRPTAFPSDDEAIVSSHNGIGFQLDTTVDKGPRTLGFKLGNACGDLMARYGGTPLVANTWYHVAGVYDAAAKTLDVYVNGKRDNALLVGTITNRQRSSREAVYVGRRSDSGRFNFAGSIDDVRIYSRALTGAEISAVMRGEDINQTAGRDSSEFRSHEVGHGRSSAECTVASEAEDARIPGIAAAVGALAAVACLGLWPSAGILPCLFAGFGGGVLLHRFAASTLPALNLWIIPLTGLVGSLSVTRSRR